MTATTHSGDSTDMLDVIISGLGPTGLVLAHWLGRAGHRVCVLEREPIFYGNARAVYTDDECMRIFQYLGLAEELQEKMLLETPIQLVGPDGTVVARYLPAERPYGWPVVNFFYQPYLETTLSERLAQYPSVSILRGRELTDFNQDSAGVTVTHQATQEFRFSDAISDKIKQDSPLDSQILRARFLVGADGGRSFIRTKLGIDMTGKSFPEPWLVIDLEQKPGCDALRHIPYFNFVMDPQLPTVSCVQPDNFHRFEFRLGPNDTKEHMEDPATVRRLLSRWVDPDQFYIKRKLVYTFNALIAKTWRVQRVLLAGDAAHMTPQFMGQGASSGVRDAANLGWKLDLVLRGLATTNILDTYQSERHSHAKAMIDASVLLKDVVSMTNPIRTTLRDLALKTAMAIPGLGSWLTRGGFKPPPVYKAGQYFGLPRRGRSAPEGTLSPQPTVRLFNGRRALLDDVLGSGFALVGLGIDPKQHLSGQAAAVIECLQAEFVTVFPYAGRPQGLVGVLRSTPEHLREVEDIHGDMIAWFRKAGFSADAVAILRPDRYTFAVVNAHDLSHAVDQLRQQLGLVVLAPEAPAEKPAQQLHISRSAHDKSA